MEYSRNIYKNKKKIKISKFFEYGINIPNNVQQATGV